MKNIEYWEIHDYLITLFFYKNLFYKNVEAEISPKI